MNEKPTKKARSNSPLAGERAELEVLAALPDEQIDTRDIPEVRDWSGVKRGLFYRPVKQQLTLRIDADVIAWFKGRARGEERYQTNINQALRDFMERNRKKAG
jgi:uncharacterized protein (DUF4415 family)